MQRRTFGYRRLAGYVLLIAGCAGLGSSALAQSAPPVQPNQVTRILLLDDFSGKRTVAELRRTGRIEWEWREGTATFRFRSVSESPGQIIIHDASRSMFHHLNLASRQTFWRVGSSGAWIRHFAITGWEPSSARLQ